MNLAAMNKTFDVTKDPSIIASNNHGHEVASRNAESVSVLPNASNVHIKGSSFNVTTNISTAAIPMLDVLYKRVATHAILNKGGRGEDAKCHPGTREEVIGLIERFMEDAEGDRIFWMSGPAGGGKTAIMKTITERSANGNRGVCTINFFFFRGDPTRNGAQPVVATLLYQLFQLYPSSTDVVTKVFSNRPRILDESIEEQFKLLSMLSPMIRQLSPAGSTILLLIDGLDECDVEAPHAQADILLALQQLVEEPDSPFRLLVASRPEANIQMAFNQLSTHIRSIFLNEEYSPARDIRIFIEAGFNRLKSSHPLKHLLPDYWPTSADISAIVDKSSGQFIYASTVMRYISHPSTVPSLGLERVKGITPAGNSSPFAYLDSIYMFILGRASDKDVMRDLLSVSLQQITIRVGQLSDKEMVYWYNPRYQGSVVESCVSELSAIVHLSNESVVFYHASLTDFLTDPARSIQYFIDSDAFREKLFIKISQKDHFRINTLVSDLLLHHLFLKLRNITPEVTHVVLLNTPPYRWILPGVPMDIITCMYNIKRLYYPDDIRTYELLLRRYIFSAVCLDGLQPARDFEADTLKALYKFPRVEEYFLYYQTYQNPGWWRRLLDCFNGTNVL